MIVYYGLEECKENIITIWKSVEHNMSICIIPSNSTIPYFTICNNVLPRNATKFLRISFRTFDYIKIPHIPDIYKMTSEELEVVDIAIRSMSHVGLITNWNYMKFIWNYEAFDFIESIDCYFYGDYDKDNYNKCGYISTDTPLQDITNIKFD